MGSDPGLSRQRFLAATVVPCMGLRPPAKDSIRRSVLHRKLGQWH
jgi:hypothetical protein